MEGEQVIGDALGIGGGAEDLALVFLQLGRPIREVVGVVRDVAGQIQDRSDKAATKLRP